MFWEQLGRLINYSMEKGQYLLRAYFENTRTLYGFRCGKYGWFSFLYRYYTDRFTSSRRPLSFQDYKANVRKPQKTRKKKKSRERILIFDEEINEDLISVSLLDCAIVFVFTVVVEHNVFVSIIISYLYSEWKYLVVITSYLSLIHISEPTRPY